MANSLTNLPDKAPEWWHELSAADKYQYFKKAYDKAVEMTALAKKKIEEDKADIEIEKETLKMLEENRLFLEKYIPFYPRWGFSFGSTFVVGANQDGVTLKEILGIDLTIDADFYVFFFKGRFFIKPGINVKIYENIGGGISFACGFLM